MIKLLTSVMMCEQDSADLGLHPDSDKYEFNKPRQLISLSLSFYTEDASST